MVGETGGIKCEGGRKALFCLAVRCVTGRSRMHNSVKGLGSGAAGCPGPERPSSVANASWLRCPDCRGSAWQRASASCLSTGQPAAC
eukprot:353183-Chlamydomonas_euryale.AAC.14